MDRSEQTVKTQIKLLLKKETLFAILHYALLYGQITLLKLKGKRRLAERLALPTSDHGVADSNPAGGEILPEPKRRFIAQSLSGSPFHRLEMTEILLKESKTLTHPSIHQT